MEQHRAATVLAVPTAAAPRERRLLANVWSWLGLLLLTLVVMAGGGAAEAAPSAEAAPPGHVAGHTHAPGAHASVGQGEPGRLPVTEPTAVEAEKDDDDRDGSSGKAALAVDSECVSFDGVRARSARLTRAPDTGRRCVSSGLARGPPVMG